MAERFISEPIQPVADSVDLSKTPIGEPPLPRRYVWRGVEYKVNEILDSWKETGRDATHGSPQQYVRKHWYHVRCTSGHEMKLYFERQARSKAQRTMRWWLYTLVEDEAPTSSSDSPDA